MTVSRAQAKRRAKGAPRRQRRCPGCGWWYEETKAGLCLDCHAAVMACRAPRHHAAVPAGQSVADLPGAGTRGPCGYSYDAEPEEPPCHVLRLRALAFLPLPNASRSAAEIQAERAHRVEVYRLQVEEMTASGEWAPLDTSDPCLCPPDAAIPPDFREEADND